ncbi:hypothetical protein Tco_0889780 [Tanacetum coccineum]
MSATLSNHIKILQSLRESGMRMIVSVISIIREPCGFSLGLEAPTVVHEDNAACIVQLKDGYIKGDKTKHIMPKVLFSSFHYVYVKNLIMVIQNSNSNVTNPNLNLNTANNSINDPLYIGNYDNPGMVLTNTSFNGSNFLGWSRTVKMALGAKLKLGFINGTCARPVDEGENLQSYGSEEEIAERYGQSNGPLIYQLQRELNNVSQGSLSVAAYFNKLKKCWDELHNLNGVPVCACGKMQECTCNLVDNFLEIEGRSKLVQFLMKLNDDYESVRNQILSIDPLPNVNKDYYIVQQVEKQKQVTNHVANPMAFFANMNQNKFVKRDNKGKGELKQDVRGFRHCTGCGQDGHSVEQYFEKIGYPDWYKGKKNKKRGKLAANVVFGPETPFDMDYEN